METGVAFSLNLTSLKLTFDLTNNEVSTLEFHLNSIIQSQLLIIINLYLLNKYVLLFRNFLASAVLKDKFL